MKMLFQPQVARTMTARVPSHMSRTRHFICYLPEWGQREIPRKCRFKRHCLFTFTKTCNFEGVGIGEAGTAHEKCKNLTHQIGFRVGIPTNRTNRPQTVPQTVRIVWENPQTVQTVHQGVF